ncbi:hypothetical protein PPL_12129 [Heterostelium album PN500]|uniref:Uncharacterized protein n=1 Tax=Heterostelium pallidum (strain ATCC 26659 / Pp 5 / PN500) TaxID=670386 RepID=D3BLS5_HETP5|nr:hypothetical protein PPL_12129 [Heterostelium album PN500]EFA77526.1 hypothetical protein PPL_12129 [Heterostelium album PN500]|eukprot:XP_020429654.1 hypothetical protein PPL_12129 [Heterostelium album PN500]
MSIPNKSITESDSDKFIFSNGRRFEIVKIKEFDLIDISSIKTIESKMQFVTEPRTSMK